MNQVQQFFEYIFNSFKIWVTVQPWESGVRVRLGKQIKRLSAGIYFRIPYFDKVFIQQIRMRVCSMPLQTLTTSDLKTITLNGALGYSIIDVEKLYKTLYHPETTLQNLVMSEVSDFVYSREASDINPVKIQQSVLERIKKMDYGIRFEYFKVTNFAVVRTYRLIQDQSWVSEGLEMDKMR